MNLGHSSKLALAAATAALVFATPAARAQEVTIGVPMALTGPYAFVGVPIKNGIVLFPRQGCERIRCKTIG